MAYLHLGIELPIRWARLMKEWDSEKLSRLGETGRYLSDQVSGVVRGLEENCQELQVSIFSS